MKLSHVVLGAIACASLVLAADATAPATATTTTTTTTTTAVKKTPAAKPAAEMKAMGMIVSVNVLDNSLIVKAKTASDTFSVDSTTKVMVAGKKAALGDLKPETHVTVMYKAEGAKKLATEITEKAAPAAAKPAATEKATEKKSEGAAAPATTPATK
jgi:hypothetical protein